MLYGRLVVPRLARRQDQIIAVSQFTAGDIDTFFGIPRGRLRVIHNGMDRERFHPGQRAAAKADLARSRDLHRPFFLYVARLEHPAKNHARLVAAFNGFKSESGLPWQLVLAGSDWNGAEVVHRLIRESPFARDIHTLGFVSEEELPTLYRAADLFVFPSLFEGFGMPPVEAMACGCPVLSSRRGALAEVVGDAAASFDPESVTDLRRQMTRLAVNLPARNDLRAKGLARAAQFDWHSTAASTLEVYASAAAGSRRRLPIQTRAPEPLSWIPEDATLRPPPDRA
jgi:glycosyltransferase involved in cell wall biosynthesis